MRNSPRRFLPVLLGVLLLFLLVGSISTFAVRGSRLGGNAPPEPEAPPLTPDAEGSEAGAEGDEDDGLTTSIPRPPPFEVVILGPGDLPLLGARIRRYWDRSPITYEVDEEGVARLPFVSGEIETKIETSGTAPEGTHELTAPRTVIRYPDLVPLLVTVVSGETGERLAGTGVALECWRSTPMPLAVDEGTVWAGLTRGEYHAPTFRVTPLPGFVMEDGPRFHVSQFISIYAEEVRVKIVTWPHARLTVRVEEADGTPAPGAQVMQVFFKGDARLPFEAALTDARGETAISGIPAMPGEPVTLWAMKDERAAWCEAVLLERSTTEVRALVVLPPEKNGGLWYRGPAGEVPDAQRCPQNEDVAGKAGLEVRVIRMDGRPARHTNVELDGEVTLPDRESPAKWHLSGVTDDNGFVAFDGLVAGPMTVWVREVGFNMVRAREVTLEDGVTTRVEIREEEGLPLTVRVIDEQGRPVSHAKIGLSATPRHVEFDGDTQLMNLYTDIEGRITLRHIADKDGEVWISADFGSRDADERVAPGSEVELTIK